MFTDANTDSNVNIRGSSLLSYSYIEFKRPKKLCRKSGACLCSFPEVKNFSSHFWMVTCKLNLSTNLFCSCGVEICRYDSLKNKRANLHHPLRTAQSKREIKSPWSILCYCFLIYITTLPFSNCVWRCPCIQVPAVDFMLLFFNTYHDPRMKLQGTGKYVHDLNFAGLRDTFSRSVGRVTLKIWNRYHCTPLHHRV